MQFSTPTTKSEMYEILRDIFFQAKKRNASTRPYAISLISINSMQNTVQTKKTPLFSL